jgi:hypothetical protein
MGKAVDILLIFLQFSPFFHSFFCYQLLFFTHFFANSLVFSIITAYTTLIRHIGGDEQYDLFKKKN